MATYLLTEMIEVTHSPNEYFNAATTKISPGLVDGDYMRQLLTDSLFDRAVDLGVLVPIP